MAQPTLEELRSSYEALARTGEWPGGGLLATDFKLHQDPMLDAGKVFHGPEAPNELMSGFRQAFTDTTFESERFIEAPAGELVVIVRVRGRGQASGIGLERLQAHVWTFDEEHAISMVVYGVASEGLRAVGLPESEADTTGT
jgi:ketosteroid isomerase-like protein